MLTTLLPLLTSVLLVRAVTLDTEGLRDTGLDTSAWTTGQLPPIADMWTANDFQMAAKNFLSKKNYVSFRTGALDETTYQSNLNIWPYVRINGYNFRDVSVINTKTTILGYNFSLPFFIAPAASAGNANPQTAELSLATAAGKAGALYVPSISSTKDIEDIAAVALPGQVMFHQEYIWANQSRLQDELDRIKKSGFKAIFLTVDNTGIAGVRTRNLRVTGSSGDAGHDATFDIQSLAKLKTMTDLPIVPKGIKTAADALECLKLGFPALYVSNHGGRTLDGAPTSVEILLDIRKNAPEVFEKMEVYADGGVRRASDIIKLLALGARAVGLGRSPMFANIYGEAGVTKLLSLLQAELNTSLQLMGQSNTNEIDDTYINTKNVEANWIP